MRGLVVALLLVLLTGAGRATGAPPPLAADGKPPALELVRLSRAATRTQTLEASVGWVETYNPAIPAPALRRVTVGAALGFG